MKSWIKTNLSKITLAIGLISLTLATTGLIIGSIAHHKTNELTYYLDANYNAHWGGNYMRTSLWP